MIDNEFYKALQECIAGDVVALIRYEENMVAHRTRSQQKQLKVQKKRQYTTKLQRVSCNTPPYKRNAAEVQQYINELNEGWKDEKCD